MGFFQYDVPFTKPLVLGGELHYLNEAIKSEALSGNNQFTLKCEQWLDNYLNAKTLLTPSCTAALEMAAILINIEPGDEVIMPSYTFVSTANAFVLRGARIVFVDVDPRTMNIDPSRIEQSITEKTKAVVIVHYAGVACDLDEICNITKKFNLYLIEDAAQAMGSTFRDQPLGTFGDLSAFSFHATKNHTSGGEGGLLVVNNDKFIGKAEVLREKGTDRSRFLRGEVDRYTWKGVGSSFLMSELQAAYLWGQVDRIDDVNNNRLQVYEMYKSAFEVLKEIGLIDLPHAGEYVGHNAHMFFIKCLDLDDRSSFIQHMSQCGIQVASHYVPLHSSEMGLISGKMDFDIYTTIESERLVRLPMWFGMQEPDVAKVTKSVVAYFN